jgi:CDP-diacylglycerol--glycerol-3-phosphate 3-phosphatidyltransferase
MAGLPTVYDLKPRFQALLRPLTNKLAALGVTANQVTVAASLLSIATGGVLALWGTAEPRLYWLFPAVLFVRMALNAIDGMLAREHGMKSRLGAILNELTDVISDAALYLPFALLPEVLPLLPVLIVWVAALTEMTGILGQTIGASRRYDGPMGKSDRASVFAVLAMLIAAGVQPGLWLNIVLAVILVLVAATVLQRALQALREGSVDVV